jgi:inner membrane protease subunit 1
MSHPLLAQLRAYAPTARRSTIVTLQLLTAFHLLTTDVAEVRLCSGFSMLPTLSHQGDFVLISPLPLRFTESRLSRAARGAREDGGVLGWFRNRNADPEGDLLSDADSSWGIKRGDIIIATSPTDPSKTVCKRVIGLEGDIIQVDPTRNRGTSRSRLSREQQSKEKPTWEEIDAQHREEIRNRRRQQEEEEEEARRLATAEKSGMVLVPVFPGATPLATPARRRHSDTAHVRIPRGHVWLAGDNLSNSTDSRAYGPVPVALLKGKVLARVSASGYGYVVWTCADFAVG